MPAVLRKTFLRQPADHIPLQSERKMNTVNTCTVIKLLNVLVLKSKTVSQTNISPFCLYAVGSKSFRPDQLFNVTEIKQLCYFST